LGDRKELIKPIAERLSDAYVDRFDVEASPDFLGNANSIEILYKGMNKGFKERRETVFVGCSCVFLFLQRLHIEVSTREQHPVGQTKESNSLSLRMSCASEWRLGEHKARKESLLLALGQCEEEHMSKRGLILRFSREKALKVTNRSCSNTTQRVD